MGHQFLLSDATVARLQKFARPLLDDLEAVVNKLADIADVCEREHSGQPTRKAAENGKGPQQFSASSPPRLTHTKVLSVKIDGVTVAHATWNGLLVEMVKRARGRLRNADDARRLIIVNFVMGKKEDEGYRFVPDVGLSVQGQDANAAWKGAYHLAQHLGVPIEVEFLWRIKEGAAHPGVTGWLGSVSA